VATALLEQGQAEKQTGSKKMRQRDSHRMDAVYRLPELQSPEAPQFWPGSPQSVAALLQQHLIHTTQPCTTQLPPLHCRLPLRLPLGSTFNAADTAALQPLQLSPCY
jgi:hypothetical protein